MGNIFIIPTPIGNLGDLTFRSKELLEKVNKIYAEDTRTTAKLLSHYNIKTPIFSYHQHNEHHIVDLIISEIKEKDIDIALVSDAGTPGISDPGFLLINKAKSVEIPVFCLPGATSLIPALVQSGFPTDEFIFFGFLPHKKGRKGKLFKIINNPQTLVLFESPHRLLKLLTELQEHLPITRTVSISREITKIHEEILEELQKNYFYTFKIKK